MSHRACHFCFREKYTQNFSTYGLIGCGRASIQFVYKINVQGCRNKSNISVMQETPILRGKPLRVKNHGRPKANFTISNESHGRGLTVSH
jgi:hypothetical protein